MLENNQEQSIQPRHIKTLIIIAAGICFLIGWFHTGQGLTKYRLLGSEYGGFVFSTMVIIIMIVAYNYAIKGKKYALPTYLFCALITFACNINSFYPNYRADSLIREELRMHRASLADLREMIKSKFQDPKMEALITSVNSKSMQLQQQCRQRGFGPLTEQALRDIENELQRSITRLRLGNTQADWDLCATQYAKIIQSELEATLAENRYLEKAKILGDIEQHYEIFSKKIDASLLDKNEIKTAPDYIEDLVSEYRNSCKQAMALPANSSKKNINSCNQQYLSPNIELGLFTHTFRSVWLTIFDGATITIVIVSFFIDFFMPLAIYLLARNDSSGHGIWVVRDNRPTSR